MVQIGHDNRLKIKNLSNNVQIGNLY
ncbi:MAG: hypothetical protein GKS07_03415 [Nitrosopumilus sp.]|nr:MAG: hypothetical protein GKS07_03415 [Nitrosopumilus sp.]